MRYRISQVKINIREKGSADTGVFEKAIRKKL